MTRRTLASIASRRQASRASSSRPATSASSARVEPAAVDGGQPQQVAGRLGQGVDPGEQQIAERSRESLGPAGSSSSAYSGLPSQRASSEPTSDGSRPARCGARRCRRCRRGPAVAGRCAGHPTLRPISTSDRRNGCRRVSSSLRKVSTRQTARCAVRDSATAKSWVDRSAQCMSSSTTAGGDSAASSAMTRPRSSSRGRPGGPGCRPSRKAAIRWVTGGNSSAGRPATAPGAPLGRAGAGRRCRCRGSGRSAP